MRGPRAEQMSRFLFDWLFTTHYGMTLGECARLLYRHRRAIDPPYWPRAAFMALTSAANSAVRWYENLSYGPKVRDVAIKPPIFILGHWRSGTTHLHNLLASDRQLAYPNFYQTVNPHTFLSTERYSRIIGLAYPKTRLLDNMRLGAQTPAEEEFATCGTLCSPFFSWVFPSCADHYDRYVTFRDVPEEEIARWKAALTLFLQKLTWKYDRPLVLKSPPQTGRIRLLLQIFPDARFIHIHRNPYAVFQSTRRQVAVMMRITGLQRPHPEHTDAQIIRRYRLMYDAFFEERELIPAARFHEVCYEELDRDPVGQVRRIYEKLDLSGFDAMLPTLRRYIDSLASYRKNEYPELSPSQRRVVAQAWRRSFDEWRYYEKASYRDRPASDSSC